MQKHNHLQYMTNALLCCALSRGSTTSPERLIFANAGDSKSGSRGVGGSSDVESQTTTQETTAQTPPPDDEQKRLLRELENKLPKRIFGDLSSRSMTFDEMELLKRFKSGTIRSGDLQDIFDDLHRPLDNEFDTQKRELATHAATGDITPDTYRDARTIIEKGKKAKPLERQLLENLLTGIKKGKKEDAEKEFVAEFKKLKKAKGAVVYQDPEHVISEERRVMLGAIQDVQELFHAPLKIDGDAGGAAARERKREAREIIEKTFNEQSGRALAAYDEVMRFADAEIAGGDRGVTAVLAKLVSNIMPDSLHADEPQVSEHNFDAAIEETHRETGFNLRALFATPNGAQMRTTLLQKIRVQQRAEIEVHKTVLKIQDTLAIQEHECQRRLQKKREIEHYERETGIPFEAGTKLIYEKTDDKTGAVTTEFDEITGVYFEPAEVEQLNLPPGMGTYEPEVFPIIIMTKAGPYALADFKKWTIEHKAREQIGTIEEANRALDYDALGYPLRPNMTLEYQLVKKAEHEKQPHLETFAVTITAINGDKITVTPPISLYFNGQLHAFENNPADTDMRSELTIAEFVRFARKYHVLPQIKTVADAEAAANKWKQTKAKKGQEHEPVNFAEGAFLKAGRVEAPRRYIVGKRDETGVDMTSNNEGKAVTIRYTPTELVRTTQKQHWYEEVPEREADKGLNTVPEDQKAAARSRAAASITRKQENLRAVIQMQQQVAAARSAASVTAHSYTFTRQPAFAAAGPTPTTPTPHDTETLNFDLKDGILSEPLALKDEHKHDDEHARMPTTPKEQEEYNEDLENKRKEKEEEKKIQETIDKTVETPDAHALKELWDDMQFLSVQDVFQLAKSVWEYWNRMWERKTKRRYSKFGANMPWIGPDMLRIKEETEHHEVNMYKEVMQHMGIIEVRSILNGSSNPDQIKAAIETLVDKGQMRWDDVRVWQAVNRISKSEDQIPIPHANPKTNTINPYDIVKIDPVTKQKLTGMDMLYSALDKLWGDNQGNTWRKKNDDAFMSEAKKHENKCDSLENDPYGNGGLSGRLKYMLENHNNKEWADPQEYESIIRFSIDRGKMSIEDKVYYFIQGLATRLLPMERIGSFDGEFLNRMPWLDYFTDSGNKKFLQDKAGQYKLPEIQKLAKYLEDDDDWGKKPNSPGKRVKEFYWKHVMPNARVQSRTVKGLRGADKMDHEDAHFIIPLADEEQIVGICAPLTGRRMHFSLPGYANGYCGYSQWMRTLAGIATEKAGEVRALEGRQGRNAEEEKKIQESLKDAKTELQQAKQQLIQAIKAYVRFDGILSNRYMKSKAEQHARLGKNAYKNRSTIDSLPVGEQQGAINNMIKRLGGAFGMSDTVDTMFTETADNIIKGSDEEKKQNEVEYAIGGFGKNLDSALTSDDKVMELVRIVSESGLPGYEYSGDTTKRMKEAKKAAEREAAVSSSATTPTAAAAATAIDDDEI